MGAEHRALPRFSVNDRRLDIDERSCVMCPERLITELNPQEKGGCVFMEGVLDRIVKRPELVRELGRQERMAAFRQLLFVAGPILSAFAAELSEDDSRERERPAG